MCPTSFRDDEGSIRRIVASITGPGEVFAGTSGTTAQAFSRGCDALCGNRTSRRHATTLLGVYAFWADGRNIDVIASLSNYYQKALSGF
jgi:hypothetical protein